MTALLEVKNLRASYGATQVLHGLDFAVEEGTITTLLGANGAGKTTTLRAICNMIKISGEIRFAGERIDKRSTEAIVRLGVAHVPEGRGTFSSLTAEENLRLGAFTRHDQAELAEDYERIYRLFPVLLKRRRQQAGTLSGGEQQMLALARALMLRPRLLLLDELSFGLAPLIVKEIFKTLQTINQDQNVTILLVEQNSAMALGLADHAYVLETGNIVFSGCNSEIQNNDVIRRYYLGC